MLKRIDPMAADDLATVTLIATEGLLLFRKGFAIAGRNLYLDAIDLAARKPNVHYAALAALRLAAEEIRADTNTKSQSFKDAMKLASRSDEPDVRHLSARLSLMAKVAKLDLD